MDIPSSIQIKPTSMENRIVSTTAYLLGISDKYYDPEQETFDKSVFDELEKDKNAKIFRSLCHLRTRCEIKYKKITETIKRELSSVTRCTDLIPEWEIKYLYENGIDLYKSNSSAEAFLIALNKQINSRVYQIKKYYPEWLKWDYIKNFFVIPGATDYNGLKTAAANYYEKQEMCPFKAVCNFLGTEHKGNIFASDAYFLSNIYEWHGEEFMQLSKVQDASEATKEELEQFIKNSTHTLVIVDCENSDPYAFYSMVEGLRHRELDRVDKVLLIDDDHTTEAWDILNEVADITVEHVTVDRVKKEKSLVDITMTSHIVKAFYKEEADSFLLVSSDSDFWGVIKTVPEAKFMTIIEHGKCSADYLNTLKANGLRYCFSDIFNSNVADNLRNKLMLKKIRLALPDLSTVNLKDLLDDVEASEHIVMTGDQKKNFYKKYLKKLSISIDDDGNMNYEFG